MSPLQQLLERLRVRHHMSPQIPYGSQVETWEWNLSASLDRRLNPQPLHRPSVHDLAVEFVQDAGELGIDLGEILQTPQGQIETTIVMHGIGSPWHLPASLVLDALKEAAKLQKAGRHRQAVLVGAAGIGGLALVILGFLRSADA